MVYLKFLSLNFKVYLRLPILVVCLFFIHTKGDLIENSQDLGEGLFWGGNIEDVKMYLFKYDQKVKGYTTKEIKITESGISETEFSEINEELYGQLIMLTS